MAANIVCPQCGTSLNPNTRFCPECGYPIQAEFYQSTPHGQPPPVQPTQKMDDAPDFSPFPAVPEPTYYSEPEPPRSRKMWYVLGGGAALLVCCGLAAIVLIVSALGGDNPIASLFSTDTPTPTATATHTPTPTITPTPPPTNTPIPSPTLPPAPPTIPPNDLGLTGSQGLTDTEFFDDFSSDALDWLVDVGENTALGYEGEAYAVEIITPGYMQVIETPLESLTHLEYSAEIGSGLGTGGIGFACYYTDIDNFVYVIFDPQTPSVMFAQYVDEQYTELTNWRDVSQPILGSRLGADCTGSSMVAYINNTPVSQIQVNKSGGPFSMWLFVISWYNSTSGMKVFFDNVSGFMGQP